MTTGTETLPLSLTRPWVGSAWAGTWTRQPLAWGRWGPRNTPVLTPTCGSRDGGTGVGHGAAPTLPGES